MVTCFVPTIGRSPVLHQLLASLITDDSVGRVIVGDNGMPDPERGRLDDAARGLDKVEVSDQQGLPFYGMWNDAVSLVQGFDDPRLAILNDDIVIPSRMVQALSDVLAQHELAYENKMVDAPLALVCPDYQRPLSAGIGGVHLEYVKGTYRHGGVTGSAFVVDARMCPRIDPRFKIWYGDDDLLWKIDDAGHRAAILRGMPMDHLGSVSLNSQSWVPEAIVADRAVWESLGRGPG